MIPHVTKALRKSMHLISANLTKGKAFFTQVMDRCDQTHLLYKLPRLFAESEEEVVRDVYGDVRHECPSLRR